MGMHCWNGNGWEWEWEQESHSRTPLKQVNVTPYCETKQANIILWLQKCTTVWNRSRFDRVTIQRRSYISNWECPSSLLFSVFSPFSLPITLSFSLPLRSPLPISLSLCFLLFTFLLSPPFFSLFFPFLFLGTPPLEASYGSLGMP